MQQSSLVLRVLPACLLGVLATPMVPLSADAQDRYRVLTQENFRREPRPDGRLLASVRQGAELGGLSTSSGWVEVVLDGWIWSQSVRRIDNDEFDYRVSARSGENLRASPNGSVLARLAQGFLLEWAEDGGGWVRVRRRGWMWGRSLQRLTPAAGRSLGTESAAPAPAAGRAASNPGPDNGNVASSLDRAVTRQDSPLRAAPDGDTTGTLDEDLPVKIIARSGEWVRVQAEGWVRESELRPGSAGVLIAVTGAEVRAQPETFEGQLLQWTLQYIAIQTADGLRPELPEGRTYVLARGPLPEAGFVYVLVTEEQAAEFQRLAPLAQLVTLVRVRHGRTRYLGNPVVELLEMSVREP